MRALIVGCGYVGMAVGRSLVDQGHEVFGLRRSNAAREEMKASGIEMLVGDITLREEMAKLAGDHDWVVNCVASSGGGAEEYRRVYLEGTRNLIACLGAKPPLKYVYTSSTSVYGQDDGSVVTEESAAEPVTETAKILRETEEVLLEATRARGFPGVILRVAGIYGPGRGHWFKMFLSGEATIEGNGERILNMIHRDDVAGALIAALHRGRAGEIYNAVDGEPVRQVDFFRWLAERLGQEMPPVGAEQTAAGRRRGVTNKRISNRKLREELGYRLRYPTFREGYECEVKNS